MKEILKKKLNKKGFTLAELLIVVAIIAVLVAIAVPIFGSSLNNAKMQVDEANMRAAISMANADYLANNRSGNYYYAPTMDDNENMILGAGSATAITKAADGYNQYVESTGARTAKDAAGLVVTVNGDTGAVSAAWTSKN